MSILDGKKIDLEITEQYVPKHIALDLDLNDAIFDATIQQEQQTTIVDPLVQTAGLLTPADARIVYQKGKQLLARIKTTKAKIQNLSEQIDKRIAQRKQPLEFEMNIRRRPALQKAVKKVFGYKATSITYEMYRLALDELISIRSKAGQDYVAGNE